MYFVLHHLFICCTVYVYVLCIFQWKMFLKNHGLYIFKCKYKVTKSYRLFSIHIKCWLKFLLIEGYPSCIGFQNWESNSLWYTCISIHTYQLTLNSKNSTTFFIFLTRINNYVTVVWKPEEYIFFFSFAFKRIFNIWYLSFIFLSASSRTHTVFFG